MMYRCDICPDDDPYTSDNQADVARHIFQSQSDGHADAAGEEISVIGVDTRTIELPVDTVVDVLHSDLPRSTRKDIVETIAKSEPPEEGLDKLF